ncbi:hypothetical protein ERJ75_000340500 [Trypanosoma vivax]|nr:hypothetical protein ERJ75_000340500 [Trypanosoma vivax]
MKVHAWTDSVRISRGRKEVEKRGRVETQNVRQCGATLGESNCLIKKREFIGAPSNRETGAVFLSQEAIGKLRAPTPLERLTVAELERLTPRVVYAEAPLRCPARVLFLSESSVPGALKA